MSTGLKSLVEQFDKDAEKALSTATIFWSVASLAVIVARAFGASISYESALPSVVVGAWIAAEISAALPARVAVSVCDKCRTVNVLSSRLLPRILAGRCCTRCGGSVLYRCERGHGLSLPSSLAETAESLFCSCCGVSVPPRQLAPTDFESANQALWARVPGDAPAKRVWQWVLTTVEAVPITAQKYGEEADTVEFWQCVDLLLKFMPPDSQRRVERLLAMCPSRVNRSQVAAIATTLKERFDGRDKLEDTLIASLASVPEPNRIREVIAEWEGNREVQERVAQEERERLHQERHEARGFTGPPCPYCGSPIQSERSKQCLNCHRSWHSQTVA